MSFVLIVKFNVLFKKIIKRFTIFLLSITTFAYKNKYQQKWQKLLLSVVGVNLGNENEISEELYIWDGSRINIGSKNIIGLNCKLWDFADITINDGCLISHNLTIVAGTHNEVDLSYVAGPVVIGSNCWIGVNVTIVGPVCIGDNVIIGAGSLVLRDLPKDTVCYGVPCKAMRSRI